MKWLAPVFLLAGCDLYLTGDNVAPDAAMVRTDAGAMTCPGAPERQTATCVGWQAKTDVDRYTMGVGTHSMCYELLYRDEATCASGCTIEATFDIGDAPAQVQLFGSAAEVMCAETPQAVAGQPCDSSGTRPCLPTHATLATDGTVAGHAYLACVSGACQPAAAPTYWYYGKPCDATVVTMHGATGVNGVTGIYWDHMCLLAWDDAAQSVAHAMTRTCIGDWQCPAGTLCDDDITTLSGTASPELAVCKRGPRGVLTPAMLAPL